MPSYIYEYYDVINYFTLTSESEEFKIYDNMNNYAFIISIYTDYFLTSICS